MWVVVCEWFSQVFDETIKMIQTATTRFLAFYWTQKLVSPLWGVTLMVLSCSCLLIYCDMAAIRSRDHWNKVERFSQQIHTAERDIQFSCRQHILSVGVGMSRHFPHTHQSGLEDAESGWNPPGCLWSGSRMSNIRLGILSTAFSKTSLICSTDKAATCSYK